MYSTAQFERRQEKDMTKLELRNISKTFTLHNRDAIKVSGFSEVTFSVKRGELLALIGPSGVGKSSILKAIYRTYLTDSGSISFHRRDGSVVDLASCSESRILDLRKREIGFVTQFLKVLPRVTAIQAVAAPLIELGEMEKTSLFQAARLLELLGIREELFHISPLTFSGGEQQRVNIARGVIAPKELLLLDEPTASLDDQSSSRVLDLLLDLKRNGIAMIGIFHDKAKIGKVADTTYEITRTALTMPKAMRQEAA
ncbi:phosphonate C-P lyase system protein PhnL [Desulfocapsa sulfexigens DSM 10523]|uniref:Phosphonate C-P lyase system protein PhnL n=1 Tax=Desulfocapsa sulfexigens (strain DSM 10523 / SB164P1) TaxID=1167006 RepID=M1PEF4_DESSD|nr:phosphonate C-P lyase system protein PhnL [Desulfocapsa sulfexigens]AGF78095.1 phosphonate C-P lyase system protein PhnL [Desulfocapsa sulfexigens DSM 10523]